MQDIKNSSEVDSRCNVSSNYIKNSSKVESSSNVSSSYMVEASHFVDASSYIYSSVFINSSYYIDASYYINSSRVIEASSYVELSRNIIFCNNIKLKEFYAFNKKVTKKRYYEIMDYWKKLKKDFNLEIIYYEFNTKWDKIPDEVWQKLSKLEEFDKEVVEYIVGFKLKLNE